MCGRSKLDLGFAAPGHHMAGTSMAGAHPSATELQLDFDLSVVADINTHTST
jgi:hypothetical protein